jgi:hypothetical protein
MSRKIHRTGHGFYEPVDDPEFVALVGFQFGETWLEPGDRVPVEAGCDLRPYQRLIERRCIAQILTVNSPAR